MRDVFIFAGQSNMSGYSKMDILGPTASVLGYSKTAGNYWTGASPRSLDSNVEYVFPSEALTPCLYNQNSTGVIDEVDDSWGPALKQFKKVGDSDFRNATREAAGSYGLEVSFIQRHLTVFPGVPVGAIKCDLGGTGLAADWMPANTGSNSGADKVQFAILRKMITEAAARLNASEPGAWRWAAFIWMQGESGAHRIEGIPADDNAYRDDARAMFGVVRSLTRSNLPVIVGRIGDNWLNTNSYLTSLGYPYAAIDASISFSLGGNGDGRTAGDGTKRANAVGGTVLRRATQVTLGGDSNCAWWDNDGYPCRPLFWPEWATYNGITVATEPYSGTYDFTAYHWSDVGNLAAGERAFTAYNNNFGGLRFLALQAGSKFLGIQTGVAA